MNELLINLDANKKTALYEQIYEYIKTDIVDGKLSCGEKLPSTRLLARGLSISRSTVETAYGQLVSEGYLEARQGSGYYVCDIGGLYDLTGKCGGFYSEAEFFPSSYTEQEKQCCGKMDGYDFLPGKIDSRGFPYHAWRKVNKEALLDLEYEVFEAGHPQGEYELREAIAAYLYQARGVRCVPEQIVIGAGNEYLLQLLGQILGDSKAVAMESPTYLQAYHTFCNIGYEVKVVPMDGGGILVEEIPGNGVSLAYVMPSHQFPFGSVMPFKRRRQLLAWAEAGEGRYIIEDDHDSEFRYVGKPIPSLHSMAQFGSVIYLGTFSNSIMPSIRVSYLVLPLKLLQVYQDKCSFYSSTVSRSLQKAICKFIEGGYFERHLNKMRGIYKGKHDELLKLLKGKTWVGQVYGDRAGLHIVVKLKCRLSEEEITRRAAGRGLKLQGMTKYYIGGSKSKEGPIFMLGFGNMSITEIKEGVAILDQCVRDI